ncbi:MAG: S9 family peptidase [Gammaproteobacteria bacterium]
MQVMRIALFLSAAMFLMGAAAPFDRQPTDPKSVTSLSNPDADPIPVDSLYYTRSVSGPAWSPDGKQVAFTTDITGRPNLWKVSASGGWPIQLSVSENREYDAAWSPDGRWIVYDSDFGGNEKYDIYAIPSEGGSTINLTNTPDVSERQPRWAPDGSQLLITYKPKDSPVTNIGVLDWKTRKVHLLTHEKTKDHIWFSALWSPDGKFIYANRGNAGQTDSNIYRIEVANGVMEQLTPHQGQVVYVADSVSPDGKTMLLTSNAEHGDDNVALLDIASRKITLVTNTGWDAVAGDFSPDGKYFTYTINNDGLIDAYLVSRDSMHTRKLGFPTGLVIPGAAPTAFSPASDRILVSFESSQYPSDLWVYDPADDKARQLTFSSIASLKPARIPAAQLVYYRSFDGKIISAFLWIPFNMKRDGSNPGVVLPHGGPAGQTVDYFNAEAAALASRGYVCIAPNVRGSTGYGIAFQKANYQDLGGGDLQDEVYAARFLVDTGYVNARSIGITGGSYGGYMTLMAISKTPNVWAAAVERYGIINWFTMLKHEDPFLQQYEISLLGDPVKDRKIYAADSPINYIKEAKAPLLVLQGDNDIRVPKEEAEQVIRIMKDNGQTVDAYFYPNEGHGFVKREDKIDALQRTLDWFDRYLKKSSR